jgi:hypothetical protein
LKGISSAGKRSGVGSVRVFIGSAFVCGKIVSDEVGKIVASKESNDFLGLSLRYMITKECRF